MPAPTEFSVNPLNRLIGTPDRPVVIDVRTDAGSQADRVLIPGSGPLRLDTIDAWAPEINGRRVVLICQVGRKLSRAPAAMLRHNGIAAEPGTRDGSAGGAVT